MNKTYEVNAHEWSGVSLEDKGEEVARGMIGGVGWGKMGEAGMSVKSLKSSRQASIELRDDMLLITLKVLLHLTHIHL